MDAGTLVALIVGSLTVLLGGVGLVLTIRKSTAADDRQRAADKAQAVADARAEERGRCAESMRQLRDQLNEMIADRNSERSRANGLQSLINERGLGRNGHDQ